MNISLLTFFCCLDFTFVLCGVFSMTSELSGLDGRPLLFADWYTKCMTFVQKIEATLAK